MSQKATIIQMLTDAGATGVTSREFNDAQIFRYSARIEELRKAGHQISTERVKGTLFRFVLRADSPSSLGGPEGTAAGLPRLDTERAGRDDLTLSAPSQTGGGGREQNTNQVDVHRSAVEAVCGSETPAISSLFDTSGFEQGSSPYDAEAA